MTVLRFDTDILRTVNATDAKGELIHQPLMKKKMDRLDASTDFRPFKFRIQAFTNAFSELVSTPSMHLPWPANTVNVSSCNAKAY